MRLPGIDAAFDHASVHEKADKSRGSRYVEQDVGSVRDHSIAQRKKGVRIAEHNAVSLCALRLRPNEVGYPPRKELTE